MARKEFKDSVWKFINILVVGGFQFLTFYLLARIFEPERYGLFVLVMSAIVFFQSLAELGIPVSSSRHLTQAIYSDSAPGDVVRAGAVLSILLGIVSTLLCLIFSELIARILKNASLAPLLKTAAILLLVNNIIRLFEELFKGVSEFRIPAILNVITRPLQLILVAGFVLSGLGIKGALYGIIISSAILAVAQAILFLTIYYPSLKKAARTGAYFKQVFLYGIPIAFGVFAYFFYTKIDVLLLSYFKDTGEIAIYNVADMIYQLPLLLVMVIGAVVSPIVTREYTLRHHGKIQKIFTSLESFTFFIMLPVSFLLFLFSGVFIRVFFPEYPGAIILLKILSPVIIIKGMGQIVTAGFLISTGRAKILAWGTAIGAILNFLSDLILIPPYGAMGAVITTAVIHSLVILILLIYLLRALNLKLIISFTSARNLLIENLSDRAR